MGGTAKLMEDIMHAKRKKNQILSVKRPSCYSNIEAGGIQEGLRDTSKIVAIDDGTGKSLTDSVGELTSSFDQEYPIPDPSATIPAPMDLLPEDVCTDTVRLAIDLNRETHTRLKTYAASKARTLSSLMTEWINRLLPPI